jgi:hypothetical protein
MLTVNNTLGCISMVPVRVESVGYRVPTSTVASRGYGREVDVFEFDDVRLIDGFDHYSEW